MAANTEYLTSYGLIQLLVERYTLETYQLLVKSILYLHFRFLMWSIVRGLTLRIFTKMMNDLHTIDFPLVTRIPLHSTWEARKAWSAISILYLPLSSQLWTKVAMLWFTVLRELIGLVQRVVLGLSMPTTSQLQTQSNLANQEEAPSTPFATSQRCLWSWDEDLNKKAFWPKHAKNLMPKMI